MRRTALLACLCLVSCSSRRSLTIEIQVPDLAGVDTPIPGVLLSALPYDRDSILNAMARRTPTPRPNTQRLDSLFLAFHAPFLNFSRVAWDLEQATRREDSLTRARTTTAAGSPAANELDARLRALSDTLAYLTPELAKARGALGAARDTLWPEMNRLRGQVRAWENSTYAGYDTVVRSQSIDKMKQLIADTSDARGVGRLRVSTGKWWIYARSPDPQDPNLQWYWNVPVSSDTIRLNSATGRRLPRY